MQLHELALSWRQERVEVGSEGEFAGLESHSCIEHEKQKWRGRIDLKTCFLASRWVGETKLLEQGQSSCWWDRPRKGKTFHFQNWHNQE